MNKLYGILLLTVTIILTACQTDNKVGKGEEKEIPMKYATMISLKEGDGYISAEFSNPWDSTKILHRYVLVPKDKEVPANLPEGDLIRTPLTNVLCYVSVHVSLFNELGVLDAVKAVGDGEYMYIDKLQNDIKSGKVIDCGKSKAIDIEKIIDVAPEAVIISAMEDNNSYSKLFNVGIPVIECCDYMETGPLQRAEWMRFYGLLMGKGEKADKIFSEIDIKYNELKDKVKDIKHKPTVLDGKKLNSSWYVAGIESTIGKMITDAGGNYIFMDETSNGSVPYSPELVLDRGIDADIWMLKYYKDGTLTYQDLKNDWNGYEKLKAFRTRNTYVVNLSSSTFYMDTPFHPERLLKEYVHMLHPEVLDNNYEPTYYQRVKE